MYFSDSYIANPQLKYFQYQKTNNTVNLQHERDGLRSDPRDKWHQKQTLLIYSIVKRDLTVDTAQLREIPDGQRVFCLVK